MVAKSRVRRTSRWIVAVPFAGGGALIGFLFEIRGQYEAALAEYAAGAAEYPEDPEPLLLGARLLRIHLDRPLEALAWLERARRLPGLTPRDEILIDRDVVELYEGPLRNPAAALPVLARLSTRHAGTKPAEWAARRLASLRTEVWQNIRDEEVEELTGCQRDIAGRGGPPSSATPTEPEESDR